MGTAHAQNNSNNGGKKQVLKSDCEVAGGTFSKGVNFTKCTYPNGDTYTCNSDVNKCEACTNGKCTVENKKPGKRGFASFPQKMSPQKQLPGKPPGKPQHSGPATPMHLTALQTNENLRMKLPKGKPNLVITTLGWRGEFCGINCSEVREDLKIDKSRCPLFITVKNNGNANAGNFIVEVQYTDWKGNPARRAKTINSLNAGQSKSIEFTGSTAVDYYRYDKPFKAFADKTNNIAESNENDNTKTVTLN